MEVRLNCPQTCQNKNTQVFTRFAEEVSGQEVRARSEAAQVIPGKIACGAAIENPAFGNFCGATLERTAVSEHPELADAIGVATIDQVPDYNMTARGNF